MSDKYILSAVAGGCSLPREDILHALSKMGKIMSKKRIHLKVAVMHHVLQMESGEVTSSLGTCEEINPFIRNKSGVTTMSVAAIFRLMVKWGYLERLVTSNGTVYRRTAYVGSS